MHLSLHIVSLYTAEMLITSYHFAVASFHYNAPTIICFTRSGCQICFIADIYVY